MKLNCDLAHGLHKKSAELEIFSQLNYQDVEMLQSEVRKLSAQRYSHSPPLLWNAVHKGVNTAFRIMNGTIAILKHGHWLQHRLSLHRLDLSRPL
jgi:hypothetical protein